MRLRAILGPLRIVLVVAGIAVVVASIQLLASIPEPPPGTDGFPAGLAFGFVLVTATAGLVVTAGGLAIPAPADSPGGSLLRFDRRQHRLVVAGFGLLAGSLVGGFGILLFTNNVLLALDAWFALGGLGLLAVVAAVGWRLAGGALALVRG